MIDTSRESLDERLADIGGLDSCIETTGYGAVIEAIVRALKRRGILVLLSGSAAPVAAIDTVSPIQGKIVRGDIFGDSDPNRTIPELIALFREGRFPVDRLIPLSFRGDRRGGRRCGTQGIDQAGSAVRRGATALSPLRIRAFRP